MSIAFLQSWIWCDNISSPEPCPCLHGSNTYAFCLTFVPCKMEITSILLSTFILIYFVFWYNICQSWIREKMKNASFFCALKLFKYKRKAELTPYWHFFMSDIHLWQSFHSDLLSLIEPTLVTYILLGDCSGYLYFQINMNKVYHILCFQYL